MADLYPNGTPQGPSTLGTPPVKLPDDTDLKPLCQLWMEKIRLAGEHKRKKIGKTAEACWQFYDGSHSHVFRPSKSGQAAEGSGLVWDPDSEVGPTFQMTFNVAAELVDLFVPMLAHRNPVRTVTPKTDWEPPESFAVGGGPSTPLTAELAQATQSYRQQKEAQSAQAEAVADLLETLLNYTPNEYDLKNHLRLSLAESLVGGMSCLWVEVQTYPLTGERMVTTTFDRFDNFQFDPDATSVKDAKWIARKYVRPAWEVEREFGLPEGSLKDRSGQSTAAAAAVGTAEGSVPGKTADLVTYWKVWSRMGMGARLRKSMQGTVLDDKADLTEQFGDFVYFAVSENVPFPLNVPWDLFQEALRTGDPMLFQECAGYLQWPVALWCDPTDPWPVGVVDFHPEPRSPFSRPHLSPALGEMAGLDWTYSWQLSHVQKACKFIVAVAKQLGDEEKEALTGKKDMAVLEVNPNLNKTIDELVKVITFPPVNADLQNVKTDLHANFQRRTGLSELLYGQSSTQSRSAADATVKTQAMQLRPDDMANRVEDIMTLMARKEAIAARLVLRGSDVAAALGPYAGQFWDQYVAVERDPQTQIPTAAGMSKVCREFSYRIEAGSARKPNKDKEAEDASQAVQYLMPILQQIATSLGVWGPLNALLEFWAKAHDLDPTRFLYDPQLMQTIQQALQAQQMAQQQQTAQGPPQNPQEQSPVPNGTAPPPSSNGVPQGAGQPTG